MPTISPTLPNDGETIDAQDVNGPFNAILGVLNGNIDGTNIKPGSLPWSVMDSFSEQIPASAMQKSGNLELFRQHAKISFIPDGLVWSALTGLNAGMTSGQYYSNSGILLPITAVTSRAFTASRDTYVSIGQNGSLGYSEVANGAAQPALPSNSNWLAKVVTNGSTVTGVTDMRQTTPIGLHNIDLSTLPGLGMDGTWIPYTPSVVSGVTLGNGTLVARYNKIGKRIRVRFSFILGSTSAITGDIQFTLPLTSAAIVGTDAVPTLGTVRMFDGGATVVHGYICHRSTTSFVVRIINASGTYATQTIASASAPFTWNTSDEISGEFEYEAA